MTEDETKVAALLCALLILGFAGTGKASERTAYPQAGLWTQYLLDNAANVEEALKLFEGIQIVRVEANGHKANVHVAIEDASGDSAIIEFIGGKPVIHHGRQYTIMTNDPTYDQQLALLEKQDLHAEHGTLDLFEEAQHVARELLGIVDLVWIRRSGGVSALHRNMTFNQMGRKLS